MNDLSRKMLESYFEEAASWNGDRLHAARSSRKIAWIIAVIFALIAVLEAIALVFLTPLKTVEPYTLLVDKTTGYVEALKPLDPTTISPDAALTRSFLVQYVIAREGFDESTLNSNYRKTALFSAGSARADYLQSMQASNPQSPLSAYPRTSIINVRVKSVSPLGHDAALVRFDTVRTDAGASARQPRPWVAIIRYRYSKEAMNLEDRFINPLGFQVTSYRKDAEALPAAANEPNPAPAQSTSVQTSSSNAYYPAGSAPSKAESAQ